jgi:fluoride exporter
VRGLVRAGLVAVGSAVGGLTRWGVGSAAALCSPCVGDVFPWGTFFINVTGSLFLGWFAAVLSGRLLTGGLVRADDLRLLVAVGFTGGYTTFSSYEYETDSLLFRGDGFSAFAGTLYFVGSVLVGLLAVRCGMLLARGRRPGP